MWNSGSTVRKLSSAFLPLSHSAQATALETRFMCVSMAPLAMPVVPPVYWRAARSSWGLICTLGGSGWFSRRSCWKKCMLGFGSTLCVGILLSIEPMAAVRVGMYSLRLVIMAFLSLVFSQIFSIVGYSMSRTTIVSASESAIWCSASRSL